LTPPGTAGRWRAGSDQADHQSEVVECLGGLAEKRAGGERLDDEVFAVPEGAEDRSRPVLRFSPAVWRRFADQMKTGV
jgi:hypothetical protein